MAESVKNDPPASEPKPKFPARFGDNPGNYTITGADALGTGTPGERIRANLAAVRLVLELERENRYPTREEQATLAKYVGWGGLKNVFKGDNSTSKQEREAYAELKRILTPDQLFWMGQSVLNAHYTSPKVVGAMYRVLRHFGIEGGRFLEPTVGTGNFIGLMPADMAASAKWFASEIDPITSLIAKNLYPDAQILPATGFQDAEFAYGRMDVAIGNPPFGDERITDTNKKRAEISGFKIHNYVISKSAMHLRPGGIMSFVVTSRFLDTANPEAREYLAKNFKFIGAFRLPNDAFAENAGTEVTTDIVFLQRLRGEQRDGVTADDMPWLDTKGRLLNQDNETVTLNRYFAENPGMLLGKPSMQGTMYGSRSERGEFTLQPIPGMDFAEEIDRILENEWAPLKGIGKARPAEADEAAAAIVLNREDVPIGGYFRESERVVQRVDDDADGNVQFRELTPETPWTEKQTLGVTRLGRIKGMLTLREMAYDLMADERADAPAEILEAKRAELNRVYDKFVDDFGFLNDAANKALMDDDPRIEFGLEGDYTKAITPAAAKRLGQAPAPAAAQKSSLLKERVFYPKQEIDRAESPADGYAISLSEKGQLDLEYIAEITDMPVDAVIADLSAGDKPLIFKDPALGRWVQEDEYLSGDVKDKLKLARGAGLDANVRALEAVQPADVPLAEIHAEFGATWLPASVYEDFLRLLGYDAPRVAVLPKSGVVDVASVGNLGTSHFRADIENEDYTVAEVFSAVASRRQLVAYDGRGDDRRVNQQRTENLGRIRNKMIAIWSDWIKSDPERGALIERQYNALMNTTVERQYDGVTHLRTVGANPAVDLRNSQKISAWRMIQSPITLLDHVVGAGKTMALITGIMERRRLGLSKKPIVVVPNHLVGQWARDWIQLYPGANILAATEKDFKKSNRRRLFARIATGKFDAVIVGHSSFGFIPVSRESELEFVRGEVKHLEAALTEAEAAEGGKKGKGDSRRVRGIKNRIAKRMEKVRDLQDKPRDNVVTFEDMGIDYLAVDELHEFKNLEYATTLSNVAGMGSPEGAKKSFDLFMKMRLLQAAGGGIAGATGTPISNSMVEMYSLLRYLNPDALSARGMEQFDAWVKAFASIEPRDEYTAAGKIKQRTVLAAFNNLPELLQMYKQVADTVTMTDLKRIYAEQIRKANESAAPGKSRPEEFPVPKVAGGGRRLDIGAPTDEQIEFMDYLIARADVLDKLKGKQRQEYAKTDNALWLMNDARKMSLDVRIINPTLPDNPSNKVNRAAKNIRAIYDKWDAERGTQLVFCDLSTPAKNATKDAAAFIKNALKVLGLDGDRAITAAIEEKSYADKWTFLESRADLMLESGALIDARRESIENFLDKVGDDELSALQVADSGFSVYDALKAKLIESGIPEREIAFIHDANTADQKRELFDLVNAGKVRVLIGSSAKMGAGTNVQKRIVALHHMDAPWRPSDIEQREGRAIRQGNLIAFDKDGRPIRKDFELEIIAYSTERTFDAQMWGVLARKAAFLEQFRMGLRSIKEVGGDAASYAEFMAEATGDQVFRDKLNLERELVDIEAEDRSAKMKRSASERIVASASSKIYVAENDLKIAQRRTSADLSSVEFRGETYRNDIAEVIGAEMALYREDLAAYEEQEQAYKVARKAWEDAAGTERGRAPTKPQPPEVPELLSERVEAKSEWARLVDSITKQMSMQGEDGRVSYSLRAADGSIIFLVAFRGSSGDVQVFIDNEMIAWGAPRSPGVASRLMPGRIAGELKQVAENRRVELERLRANIEQAKVTLEQVQPVDPQRIADLRARYEAVKTQVDQISERMAIERAQRRNRFIERDSKRFPGGVASAPAPAAPTPPSDRKANAGEPRFRFASGSVAAVYGAEDVAFDGLGDYTFFALADGEEPNQTWHVIENSTGLSVGKGGTREEAIKEFKLTIQSRGLQNVREVIQKANKIDDKDRRGAIKAAGGDSAPSVLRDAPGQRMDFRPVSLETAAGVVAGVRRATQKRWDLDLHLAPTFDALPDEVKQDVQRNYGQDARPSGVTFGETVYVIADEHGSESDLEATILHEVKGHVGVRRFYGDNIVRDLNQLFLQIGGYAGIKKLANDRGIADLGRYAERLAKSPMSDDDRVRVMMEEVLAHIAEAPRFVDRIKAIIGKVRAMLRETGLVRLAEYGETDLLHILKQAEGKLGQRPDPSGPSGGIKSPAAPKLGEARARITETEAFKKWFVSSRVVDAEGRPLVVYHGTTADFDSFDPAKRGSSTRVSDAKKGFFFVASGRAASEFTWSNGEITGSVMPVYLSMRDPLDVSIPGEWAPGRYDGAIDQAMREGRDGVIVRGATTLGTPGDVFIAFRPEQVKSATGNAGTFDPTNPSILASRNAADPVAGLTPAQFRAALVERFGEKGVATLERGGLLNIGTSDTRGLAAWYEPNEGRAYFDPSRMGSTTDVIEAVLHEIGEHHGLRDMLGDRGWQTLRNRLAELAAEGDNEVAAAWAGVIDNYPEFERYAKDLQAAIESDRFVHEVLAKLGESAAGRKSSVWRDLLAAINRFLLKMGVGRQINKAEIADLVEGSLKRQMRGKGVKRSLWMAGEPVMARRGAERVTAAWTPDRLTGLLRQFAYGMDANRTKAYAAWISPEDFLGATAPASDRDQLESERRPLDADALAAETQPIFLEVESTEDDEGTFRIVGHEGRHRMMALRDAGVRSVPVVLRLRDAKRDARAIDEPFFMAQRFGDGLKGARGFYARAAYPLSYANEQALREDFGSAADVMFQRPFDAADYLRTGAGKRKVRDKLADLFDGKSAKTFNWWQRTVGSQYGKARADADFGRVYEKAHDFIDGVSEFARSASDKAMGILPHMDTVGDVVKGLNARRAWSDAKDYQAISDAIFTGTLEDKVWNAGELRARFGLDDKQASLYKQFRDATDFSLETLASSEMARTARAEGMELADARMSMAEAESFYVGQIEPLVTAAREVIEGLRLKHRIEIEDAAGLSEAKRDALIARQARERMAAEGALAKVAKLRDSFTEKAEQIRALHGKGYAPLMRFGQYTVDVVRLDEDSKPAKDDDGEIDRPFFGMFESEAEAREAEKIMRDEYPGYVVSRGVASTESSELYQGLSPEAAEMFARLLGVDVNDAFQTYLRQALNNRSAMKRLIKRKGMAGFANDIPRVLASFIASNARLASSNWHFGEMRKAAAAIPKHKGDVTDEAIKLMNYIQNPQEEAAAMRGFLFFNFLGGSLASAIVNTTQTFSTTLPYLNQFGAMKAAKAIGGAMALGGKAMASGLDVVKDKDLRAALKRAAEDGIIDPQEIHLLMAEARGSGASNVLGSVAGLINESWRTPAARVGRAAMGAWGSFFSMAEKYNRHVAFIAAWDVAKDMTAADFKRIGVADRFEFARRAVIETQFDYTKASRPNWARGAIGATLFTFKTFIVNYMEFLSRLPSRERAVALGVLFLLSGLSGAPGTDDLDDLIDTIGQKLGYNWNNESGRHAWLVDVLGKEGANFVEHGISAFIPLDVSARLGMGNLIPGTGLLKDSTTTPSREIAEIFGPAGSVFMGAVDTFGNVGTGKDPLEMLRPIMPKAINDFRQAYDIASSGEYRDFRGRKVVDADLGDAFIKAIGFHPNVVAEPKRVERMVQQSVALHRTRRAEINETWARGVVEKDPVKIERAREMLRDWNRKNPTAPIRMNPESVKARVRAMRSTSADRLVKASSKDMRGMVASEIAVKD